MGEGTGWDHVPFLHNPCASAQLHPHPGPSSQLPIPQVPMHLSQPPIHWSPPPPGTGVLSTPGCSPGPPLSSNPRDTSLPKSLCASPALLTLPTPHCASPTPPLPCCPAPLLTLLWTHLTPHCTLTTPGVLPSHGKLPKGDLVDPLDPLSPVRENEAGAHRGAFHMLRGRKKSSVSRPQPHQSLIPDKADRTGHWPIHAQFQAVQRPLPPISQ